MIRGKTLDAAIFDQARERSFHRLVPLRSFSVAVGFPPCHKRLGCGTMNVTGVADLPMYMDRPVVANQAQRLAAAPHQRHATRKITIVIQVLPPVDPVDRPVVRYSIEIPLLLPPRLFKPARTGISHPLGGR